MVDLLGHHPSVAIWCAHNEPLALDLEPDEPVRVTAKAKIGASMFLPTWNKDVLDRSLARQISRSDPTRAVVRHSGVLPGTTSTGTDTHAFFGWYYGTMDDLAPALRRLPRVARFVTEFGAQAVPETNDWMHPEQWPALDWDDLTARHAYQRQFAERFTPPAECKSFEEWSDATQAYQAALLQLQIEDLRRLKYTPTGGFVQYFFADMAPAISAAVLDHERVPKRGYHALRAACRPVLAMVEPREGLVHVVSERRDELAGATIEVQVDGHVHRFGGDVAPDAVTYVGRVDTSEALDVEAAIEHPVIGRVVNHYSLLLLDACRKSAR
jgi:beta-mannosidase